MFNISSSVYDLCLLLLNSVCKTASVQVPELLMESLGSSRKPSAPAPAMLKQNILRFPLLQEPK